MYLDTSDVLTTKKHVCSLSLTHLAVDILSLSVSTMVIVVMVVVMTSMV